MSQEVDEEKSVSTGLVIQGSDFALKAFNDSTDIYDLYLLKVVNKGKENQKFELKTAGYGMSLARCVKKIIQYRVTKRKAVYTGKGDEGLREFLKVYQEESAKIFALFEMSPEELQSLNEIKQVRVDAKERILAEIAAQKAAEKAAKKAAKLEAKNKD